MTKRGVVVGAVLVVTILAFAVGRYSNGPGASRAESGPRVLYYTCPMHPSVRSDRPGKAPCCGMDMVAVYADADPAGPRPAPGVVSITPDQQELIGVRVETVAKRSEARVVRTTGRIEVDGDRLHRLMAGVDGWIESVRDNPVGTIVKKDELLATLYSRESRNAQQAYLGSLASLDRLRGVSEPNDAAKGDNASLRVNEEQLRALGMGDFQIEDLRKTRRISSDISVTSPIDGVVLSRAISPGQRCEPGAELYEIADLSHVWIVADVLGVDPREFRAGDRVRVAVRERPVTVYATVGQAPPFFDPESHTLKVRLEADNPGLALRPGMFVDIELPLRAAPALTVPVDALLDSGLSEQVFVQRAAGEFEPRAVKTGWRTDDRVEIVSGLSEGEKVVVSGTFLLDSECRLKLAAAGIHEAPAAIAPPSERSAAPEPEAKAAAMPPKQAAKAAAKEVRDPKCGMTVDAAAAASAGLTSAYRGATYYFCSPDCKLEFEKNPERYLKPAGFLAVAQRGAGHD